jgi:hypothetical protein
VGIDIALATEDALSEAVAIALLQQSGREYRIWQRLRRKGFGYLKSKAHAFNQMAFSGLPVLLLTDLDRHPCAPALRRDWLPGPISERLLFRVAVREVESWLIADPEGLAGFLGISRAKIPLAPDQLPEAKGSLLSLVKTSRKRALRSEILPAPGSTAPVGLGYNLQWSRFVRDHWSPRRAAERSPSLQHARLRIREFSG